MKVLKNRYRLPLLMLLTVLSVLTVHAQYSYNQSMRYGFLNLGYRNYDLAQHFFRNALKARPGSAEAYVYLAISKLELEDFKGAECDADSALARNSYSQLGRLVRGYTRLRLGMDSLAICDLDHVLQYDPYNQDAQKFRAIALAQAERHEEAIEAITRVMPLMRDNPEIYSMRAYSYLSLKDTTAAVADLDTCISLSPVHINAHIMRCDIMINRKQWAQAAQDMDEIIRQNPYDYRLYLNRAVVRYNYDNWQGAMSDLNEAIKLRPDHVEAVYNRALLKYEVMDLKGAAADFGTVLKLQPNNFEAMINRMQINLELKHYRDALADMQRIVQRYPRFYVIYYMMAEVYLKLGNQQAYFANIRKADDMVRNYVDNPKKYRLDKPTISRNQVRRSDDVVTQNQKELTEEDIIERYNQLVTAPVTEDLSMDFTQNLQRKVQDRNMAVVPEGRYVVSPVCDLQARPAYFKSITEFNQALRSHIPVKVAASPNEPILLPYPHLYFTNLSLEDAIEPEEYVASMDSLQRFMAVDTAPELKIYRATLNNVAGRCDAALEDVDAVLAENPDMPLALLLRAEIRLHRFEIANPKAPEDETLRNIYDMELREVSALAMADLDRVAELDNTVAGVWYNKGCIYFAIGDLPSALNCFSYAISMQPEFAEAYYNRALTYLRQGDSADAIEDLRKAGSLGVLRAYYVMKKFQ